uniref:Uncharacterized protein n=1 Tax=Arundo donax TaxID=35708 RepID=A0A0A9G5F6_ARUDO
MKCRCTAEGFILGARLIVEFCIKTSCNLLNVEDYKIAICSRFQLIPVLLNS